MPKEQINYDRTPDIDGVSSLAPEFSLHWNSGPGEVVQLGVEFDVKVMREHLDLLAKHSPTDKRTAVYSAGLERDDIQKMIRAGKRARNAVFGADE